MGFFSRLFGTETRAAPEQRDVRLSDPYLAHVFGLQGRGAVTPDTVMSSLAVAARCVGLRSELMASVGLHMYRRTDDGGRERAEDNPLYSVLHDLMNPGLSAFEGREFLVRSLDLTGNAYAAIEWNARGHVTALYPFPPLAVGVERLPSGRLRYRFTDPRGASATYTQDEVLHIRGPSRDLILGMSQIQIAAGSLSLALAQRQTAASLMENSLRPSGILTFPDRLSVEQQGRLRAMMDQRFGGAENAGRAMIMDGGAKFEHLTFTPEDAEFLANMKLSNEDTARIFGVPPTSVGITDKATYSNTEQEATALVQNALGPLAKRIEAALQRCVLTAASRRTYYVEHDLDSLLRGDIQARFEAYRIGREIGALSPNDIRRKENDPPIEGGNVYHQPANWVPLGTKIAGAPTPVP